MKMLLLGGTAFLGRAIADAALRRGVQVVCLARGTGTTPPGAELIRADRDRDDALATARHTDWDAVLDLTRHPIHARRAVRDLRARHWVYVSSGSVYATHTDPDQPETAPTLDPLRADTLTDMSEYGRAKAACEQIYRAGARSLTVIRPGLIGGDGDPTGRSGYYPWRFAHPTGSDVLVPDDTFPTALIDVEDLAQWVVDCAEQHHAGTFNAAGPTTTLGEVYALCGQMTGTAARPRVVDDATLLASGIAPWMGPTSLPLWIPEPSWRYVATLDSGAARRLGLHTRPLRETLSRAGAYEETRTGTRPAGLTDEEECELRARLTSAGPGTAARGAAG